MIINFGFRRHHSTCLALIDVVDQIYQHLDNHEFVLGIYLDLQTDNNNSNNLRRFGLSVFIAKLQIPIVHTIWKFCMKFFI